MDQNPNVITVDAEIEVVPQDAGGNSRGDSQATPTEQKNMGLENFVKNKRKQLRSKFTRAVNRVKASIQTSNTDHRRLQKELGEIRHLCHQAGDVHSELYEICDETGTSQLDKWEADLMNDLYTIELEVEDYLKNCDSASNSHPQGSGISSVVTRSVSKRSHSELQGQSLTSNDDGCINDNELISQSPSTTQTQSDTFGQSVISQSYVPLQAVRLDQLTINNSPSFHSDNLGREQYNQTQSYGPAIGPGSNGGQQFEITGQSVGYRQPYASRQGSSTVVRTENLVNLETQFDSWIDELVEFRETQLHSENQNMSIADALYKLEASKDIPTIQLVKFDGNPLQYVEFVERFKIHIHNKCYLSDDMRMVQLRMHVTGEAERAISGLGSGGIMYATAMKILKDQFGQRSVIARALINKLTKGDKIAANNRQKLREFSLDVMNALATFHQIKYLADMNANENLRQAVMRLPDHMIHSWKVQVSELRDRGKSPSLDEISGFIRRRVKAEYDPDFGDLVSSSRYNDGKGRQRDGRKGVHVVQTDHAKKLYKCFVCQQPHKVFDCPTFIDSAVSQRVKLVKDHKLCFSCLIKGHISKDCRSKKQCNKNGCTKLHHPLLHSDPPCASGTTSALDNDSIMPVVRVMFVSANGRYRQGNVLIDSGAGTTIIRKEFSKALGLQGKCEGLELSVVGGQRLEQPDSRRVKFWIKNLSGGEEFPIEAHEIDCTILSVPALNQTWLKSFSHLKDVNLSHKAGPIDLILGVQYSHLHAEAEVRQGLPFEPVGKLTRLGWYVIGADKTKKSSISCVNFVEKVNLEKFYQFETLGIQAPDCRCAVKIMSRDDKKALDLFEASCRKVGDRYEIGLPWKEDRSLLRNNYVLAEKRLLSLEKSLRKNSEKANAYDAAIMEYEQKGWAEKLNEENGSDSKPVYYLPHHGVFRPDKVSTPLRIVFDPACQFQGVSLNSLLLKGPCLIGNLLGVLLRFREDVVAFTGDISKMFLQVRLPEADTDVHRFLWRNMDSCRDPDIYRLLRVTFGDKPSPDMASYVMLRIAEDNQLNLPRAATVLKRDRYMDDLIHSCASKDEADQTMAELDEALATGSFKVKYWICSANKHGTTLDNNHIDSVGQSGVCSVAEVNLDGEDTKTLGVCWNPSKDTIKFVVKDVDVHRYTKRAILSKISTLFDPLGLVSVATVKARVGMQDIWRCKELDWDDPLPAEMVSVWRNIFSELEGLDGAEFPRCLKPVETIGSPELHVFADASAKVYGSVAYLLWPTEDGPQIRLIGAKGRVAPLKQTTIPRLELMAALVSSRLARTISDEFKIKPVSVTFWSDSQIVLHWVRSESLTLKAFVGVRVAEIQSMWDPSVWRFVPTELNPADDLTRGISREQMEGRWKHGPEFLRRPKDEWPADINVNVSDDTETKKAMSLGAVIKNEYVIDPNRFSSWRKLLRVTAYCFKFIDKIKGKLRNSEQHAEGTLQPDEIERAEHYWVLHAQMALGDWKHQFRDLAPFAQNNLIRVGGRLRNAPLEYDCVHPMLLPSSHPVSKLIMMDTHNRMGHVGVERTLCECRRKYWIVRGRNLAKRIVRQCAICRKLRQPPHTTVMADLPSDRLKPFDPPFSVTGIDLFGPFKLKFGRNKTTKAWGAVFTCATTRALHLEIVDGLSTSAFLHALRRFASHHGWPQTLISDNGSNFVGAQAELRKLVQEGQKQLQDFASLHKVRWVFITPLSPHQGGFYESVVKQTKRALQVAIGQQVLTWNEMATAFAEAQSLVNSRPLGFMPNNPNDPQPLTPNNFILGRASAEIPSGPFEETKDLRKRFQQTQMIVNHFWKRFIREYFPTLTKRTKWQLQGRQIQVDDIVLLTDLDTPRGKWTLGRVLEVFPGADGVVRNVRLKTKHEPSPHIISSVTYNQVE